MDLFYEFLGGGKPAAAPPTDDLANLLDAAGDDLDIEFSPGEIESRDEPPKPKPPAMMTLAE